MSVKSIATLVVKDIEVAADKVLSFIAKEQKVAPGVVAALGVLLGQVGAAVSDTSSAAAQSGLNLALDSQTFTDIKAVWPDVKAFAAELGIKL
jgi:hypothetical protein